MPDDSSRFFHTRRPRVVATIGSVAGWYLAEKITSSSETGPDLLEIRADLLLEDSSDFPGDLAQLPLPLILTVRHPSEGGKPLKNSTERAAIYRRYWDKVVAIDLELSTAPDFAHLIAEARASGISCILSYHNFTETPSLSELETMTLQTAQYGADLFKVATTTHSASQLSILLSWVESEKNLPLAAMGMGSLGKISRPLLAQLGSQLNYGYLDKPIVPGQWPAGELRRVIDSLLV